MKRKKGGAPVRPTRAGVWKTTLLTLFWALSVAALSIALTVSGKAAAIDVSWSRTLPYAGISFIAAVALGLGYRALGRLPRAFANLRFWTLSFLFAAVATLGESFAQTGTAQLVSENGAMALLYFAGRVPAFYMGMQLLMDALCRFTEPTAFWGGRTTDRGGLAASAAPVELPAWVENARKRAYTDAEQKPEPTPYKPPLPAWAARVAQEKQTTQDVQENVAAEPVAASDDVMPAFPTETVASEPVAVPVGEVEAYRSVAKDVEKGAWSGPTSPKNGQSSRGRKTGRALSASRGAPDKRAGLPVWGFALLLVVCWLPYLFAVWPGTVSNDSITQLAEIFGAKPLGNGNPLAQTGLLWLAVQAGRALFNSADAAVALYVCVQAALLAWLLGYTLRRIADTGAPRWLTVGSAAFFALCPIFPTFAFCVGKDTVFAMAVLWFTLLAWRVLSAPRARFFTTFWLCVSAAACAFLRNAGAALVGVTLAAMFIRSLRVRQAQWRAPLLALASAGAALAVLYILAIPAFQVQPALETENWSAPLQQVARAVAGNELTEDEKTTVNAVLPVDELQAAYNGELSDPVKTLWHTDATPEQKSAFFGVWLRLGLREPATYLSALFHNGYGYLLPGYVSVLKPTFLLGMEGRTTLIDGKFDFTVNPGASTLKKTLQSLFAYAPFRMLCAPGLYGWLALFALAGALGCVNRRNALPMLPALLTLLGCLFSAVNGYFRYALPLYFLAPPMLAMLSQTLRSGCRYAKRDVEPL
jgi:hypothetical protein